MFKNWDEFIQWAEVKVLTGFIEGGGKGLRAAVQLVIYAYSEWDKQMKAKENKKHGRTVKNA